TNTHEPETTEVNVKKIWDDDDNRDGVRADFLHITLSGSDGKSYEADLTEETGWAAVITNLPVYFNHGEEIIYTIAEDYTAHYEADLVTTGDGYGFTFINTHEITKTSITVTKTWEDAENQDGVRPDEVEVVLTGSDGSRYSAVLTEETGWTYTFTDLPVYWNKGDTIDYSLQETAVDGYSDEVVKGEDGYSFTVTNNHIPAETDVVIRKVWDDDDNRDGIRPNSVHVVLNGSDGSSFEADLTRENGFVAVFTGLPVYFNEGEQIAYTIEEEEVSGYECTVEADADGYTFVITNSYTPQTKDLTVIKLWDDAEDKDGIRADVSLTLLGSDGIAYEGTIEKDAEDQSFVFSGLPVYYNGGQEIIYTLFEAPMEGYTSLIEKEESGFIVTNTHEPEKTPETEPGTPGSGTPETTTADSVETGDNTNLWLPAMLAILSLACGMIAGVSFFTRRKNRLKR
ncbi:MAG: Cna B-type domain-containing protein, partial [Lachnospiraceae bacterium]|nr:Cna B-type domain-containing protein [Lachnospiraceae bacterium]